MWNEIHFFEKNYFIALSLLYLSNIYIQVYQVFLIQIYSLRLWCCKLICTEAYLDKHGRSLCPGVALNWSTHFHITLQKCFYLTPPMSGNLQHDSVICLSAYESIARWLHFNRIIVTPFLIPPHNCWTVVSAFINRRNRGRMRTTGAVFILYSGAHYRYSLTATGEVCSGTENNCVNTKWILW